MKWSLFEKGIWRRRLAFGLCLVLLLGILPFPDGMGGSVEMGKITAEAEENVPPFKQRYYFSVKGDFVAATGGDTYTMGSSSEVLSLYDSFNEGGLVTTGTTITLNENNSKNVVEAVVNKTGGNRPSETSIQLTVRGPGKTTIKGTIINANNESLEFSFNVEVELDLDKSKPTDNKGKAYYYIMRPGTDQAPEGHSLKVRYPGIKHQLAVKYVTPSNGAISGDYKYDYSGTDLEWVSDNENVIKIAGNGIEQAVGGVLEAEGSGYSK